MSGYFVFQKLHILSTKLQQFLKLSALGSVSENIFLCLVTFYTENSACRGWMILGLMQTKQKISVLKNTWRNVDRALENKK